MPVLPPRSRACPVAFFQLELCAGMVRSNPGSGMRSSAPEVARVLGTGVLLRQGPDSILRPTVPGDRIQVYVRLRGQQTPPQSPGPVRVKSASFASCS